MGPMDIIRSEIVFFLMVLILLHAKLINGNVKDYENIRATPWYEIREIICSGDPNRKFIFIENFFFF